MPRNANGRPGANPDRTAADSSHDGDGTQHSPDAFPGLGGRFFSSAAVAAIVERASELDRGWFERHRHRAHRLRPSLRDEFPGAECPAGTQRLTLVKQITPGCRQRVPLYARRRPCSCEACVADLWEVRASDQTKRIALDLAAIMLRGRG